MGEVLQCVKCENPSTIAGCEGKNVAYCDGCYRDMITHKFRSALGKKRVFKDGASKSALVVSDGSPESAFLLGQLKEALALDAHKRLVMEPTIITVVSSLSPGIMQRVEGRTIHLAAVLRDNSQKLDLEGTKDSEIERLATLTASCRSGSAKAELLRILKERLVLRLAAELSLCTVLVPESADFLARLALTSLCLGRGGQISDMTAMVEKRRGNATIVRPLKEIRTKEIAMGNRLFGWESMVIFVDGEEARVAEWGSIQGDTHQFVETLQGEGFQATVSTVLSTASKVHSNVSNTATPCKLCLRSFSRELSTLCPPCSSVLDEIPDWNSIRHLMDGSS